MKLSKADRRTVRGCLEVRARVPSRMGSSDFFVPPGTVGFVLTVNPRTRDWLVYWTGMPSRHVGDCRTGSHSPSELEPTGSRG
jgi:hypothetical protein